MKTFEGTWEEICQHADELAGCHVRVTVMEPRSNQEQPNLEQSLAGFLQKVNRLAEQRAQQGKPPLATDDPGEEWAEPLLEKFRKMGFDV